MEWRACCRAKYLSLMICCQALVWKCLGYTLTLPNARRVLQTPTCYETNL